MSWLYCHCMLAGERQWGFGVVVSVLRKSAQDRVGVPESAAAAYLVDTLLCVAGAGGDHKQEQERKREAQGAPAPAPLTAANAEMQVGGLALSWVCGWVGSGGGVQVGSCDVYRFPQVGYLGDNRMWEARCRGHLCRRRRQAANESS